LFSDTLPGYLATPYQNFIMSDSTRVFL